MPTLAQLESALIAADAAGDHAAAIDLTAAINYYRKDKANLVPNTPLQFSDTSKDVSALDIAKGIPDAALTLASGATAGLLGMVAGGAGQIARNIASGTHGTAGAARDTERAAAATGSSLTYEPRTKGGKAIVEAAAKLASSMPLLPGMGVGVPAANLASGTTGIPAMAQGGAATAARVASEQAARAAPVISAAVEKIKPSGSIREAITGKPYDQQQGAQLAQQGGIAQSGGAAATDEALMRETVSQNLYVPITLTKGEVHRDSGQLGFEKEMLKNADLGGPLRDRVNQNNQFALQNIDIAIDKTGGRNIELEPLGKVVDKVLAREYRRAKAKTNAQYEKAFNSQEAKTPVSIDPLVNFLNNAESNTSTSGVYDAARRTLVNFGMAEMTKNGQLITPTARVGANLMPVPTTVTLGNLHKVKREINDATGYNPRELVQNSRLKDVIIPILDANNGKEFLRADVLRRQQAKYFEDRAIINKVITTKLGTDDRRVAIEDIFDHTILNGSLDDLSHLKKTLHRAGSDGVDVWNDLRGATVSYLRNQATKNRQTDANGIERISGAAFHKTIAKLDEGGKLSYMLGNDIAQRMRDLNIVLGYIETVPPGTLINSSGTSGALMSAMMEMAASGAMFGVPMPVISTIRAARRQIADNRIKVKIERALRGINDQQRNDTTPSTP